MKDFFVLENVTGMVKDISENFATPW